MRLRKSGASYCLVPASDISFVVLNSHYSSFKPIGFSNESCIDEEIPGTVQSNYSSFLEKKTQQTTHQNIKKKTHNVKEKGSGEHPGQVCDP